MILKIQMKTQYCAGDLFFSSSFKFSSASVFIDVFFHSVFIYLLFIVLRIYRYFFYL